MATRKTRAQTKTSQSKMAITPIEYPTSGSLSENQQASSCDVVEHPSGEVPSKVPPPFESPSKDQTTPESSAKDRQPAEDPTKDQPAEFPKNLAVATPFEDQPTTESLSEDPKPAADRTVIPPAGEIPFKTPSARESSTPPLQLGSPSKGQPTTEVQAGDRQTVEGPTANQHTEKVPVDPPALETLSNGECTANGPTEDLPQGEIPKEPTENSSQDQSTAERPSEDHTAESLPIIKPATEALPSSGELSDFVLPDIPMADSAQEPPTGFSSSQPGSDIIKEDSQHTKQKADGQKPKGVNSQKRVRILREPIGELKDVPVICIDSDDDDDFVEILSSRPPHNPSPKRKASSSPEPFQIDRGEFNGEQMSRKRLKHERTKLPGPAMPDSPEGCAKASEDESKRRKGHSHKFTERHLSKHMDDESRWFEAISKRCDDLTKFSTQQTQCIGSLETLDFEISMVIAEMSADSMPRNRRMQIRNQLVDMEEKRRAKSAELRRITFSIIQEGTLIKQNLASWYAKEQKVTQRIEKSR